jgi:hypothetical protein
MNADERGFLFASGNLLGTYTVVLALFLIRANPR